MGLDLIHCARCGEAIVRPAGAELRCTGCIAQDLAARAHALDGQVACAACGRRVPLAEATATAPGPGHTCHACLGAPPRR